MKIINFYILFCVLQILLFVNAIKKNFEELNSFTNYEESYTRRGRTVLMLNGGVKPDSQSDQSSANTDSQSGGQKASNQAQLTQKPTNNQKSQPFQQGQQFPNQQLQPFQQGQQVPYQQSQPFQQGQQFPNQQLQQFQQGQQVPNQQSQPFQQGQQFPNQQLQQFQQGQQVPNQQSQPFQQGQQYPQNPQSTPNSNSNKAAQNGIKSMGNTNSTMPNNTAGMSNVQQGNGMLGMPGMAGVNGYQQNQQYPGIPGNTRNTNPKPGINLIKPDQGDDEYQEIIEEITTTSQLPQVQNPNMQNPGTLPQNANGQGVNSSMTQGQQQTIPLPGQPQQPGLQNMQQSQPQQSIGQQPLPQQQAQIPYNQNPVSGMVLDNMQLKGFLGGANQIQGYPVLGQGMNMKTQSNNNIQVILDYPDFKSKNLRKSNPNNSKSNSYYPLVNITPIGLANTKNNNAKSNCCDEKKSKKCMDKCQFRGGMDNCLVNIDISYIAKCGEERFRHLDEACICKESRHRYNIINHYVDKKK